MKTYLFTAFLVAASSFAQAGTLETIPRGSKIEFKGSANIRPGITALYWQNGRMSDDAKSIQFGKYCVLSFEASGVDRALKPGLVFSIESLGPANDSSPVLTLGRETSSAKAKLNCYEKFVPPKTTLTAEVQPKEAHKGALELEISEFEKITGQDFRVIASPTIDFEPTFPKPVPGDQRKFDKDFFDGSIKLNRDVELKKNPESYFSEAVFINGQLNAKPKDLDIVCSLIDTSPALLKAGGIGATEGANKFLWFRDSNGLELLQFDCFRVKARTGYSYGWSDTVTTKDRDDSYKPTVAEVHKALGSIATLKISSLK